MGKVINRKLITTFVTVTMISLLLAFTFMSQPSETYNLGNKLMAGSYFYMIYVGAIVLVYGNTVSFLIESIFRKWLPYRHWMFILLHGVFGLANGLLFQHWTFALYGMGAAVFYAITDRWIYIRNQKQKSMKGFLIVPIVLYGFSWGILEMISPDLPPFTKEDAVQFATSGKGTSIEQFPEKIGEIEETIADYKVTRTTEVKENGHESYFVTFTETWLNQGQSGSWYLVYKVKRGQMMLHEQGGSSPPYR
ncbi:hypothetical protein [Aquibacillus sediminis]|uniref:hypothetical protein n=1 Tax=Aquibacillus sediminis TaxID=2574734 RepID=UPI001109006A|nr:hypothetical protein [Aquibacillus sediminis]